MDKHRLIVDSVVVRFGEKTVLTGGYITSETGMVTGLLGSYFCSVFSDSAWASMMR
jgi:hypothetical protein